MELLKKIVGSIIGMSLRIIVLAFVVSYIYRWSHTAYDFGFRVFSEKPVSMGSGRDVEITVPMGKSVLEVGEILEEHGLIRDAKLFYCQEFLSSYHGELKPGEFTLNTSMTAEDMMAVMAATEDDDAEDEEG